MAKDESGPGAKSRPGLTARKEMGISVLQT